MNGHQYTTYTLRNGSFSFPHVPTGNIIFDYPSNTTFSTLICNIAFVGLGIYLLEVLSIHDQFSSVKLKVSAETGVIKAAEYKYPGSKRYAIEYPLFMTAIAPVMYFQQHPPFSIIGIILGNPMLIMMAFSFVVVLFIPMLMNNLSEEELKEIQENSPGDPMKMMQSMLGVPSESKAIDDE